MTPASLAILRRQLMHDEGVRLTVYDDATGEEIRPGYKVIGHPTISFGVRLDSPGGITNEESDFIGGNRLQKIAADLERTIPWMVTLSEARQRTLVNMAYQVGVYGLLGFRNMLDALRDGRNEEAADHALDSRAAWQSPNRWKRHAAVLRTDAEMPA